MNAYSDEEIEVIRIEARAEDRAKIVEWLKNYALSLEVIEESIARGDHLK